MGGYHVEGFLKASCMVYKRKVRYSMGAFYRISIGYFMRYFVKVILPAHPTTP